MSVRLLFSPGRMWKGTQRDSEDKNVFFFILLFVIFCRRWWIKGGEKRLGTRPLKCIIFQNRRCYLTVWDWIPVLPPTHTPTHKVTATWTRTLLLHLTGFHGRRVGTYHTNTPLSSECASAMHVLHARECSDLQKSESRDWGGFTGSGMLSLTGIWNGPFRNVVWLPFSLSVHMLCLCKSVCRCSCMYVRLAGAGTVESAFCSPSTFKTSSLLDRFPRILSSV